MNNIEETAHNLIQEFSSDSETSKRTNQIQVSDPFVELKLDLLSFFKDRINRISSQEKLKERTETELESFIDQGDLTFEQVLQVYRQVSTQTNNSADSLLSLFKPTPGAPSILADNLAKQEEKKDVYDELYEQFSGDQLQKIDKLNRLLSSMIQHSKSTESTESTESEKT